MKYLMWRALTFWFTQISQADVVCRKLVTIFLNFSTKKKIKIQSFITFHCHIWIQYEKSIQVRTNKSSIGSVVCEIVCKILRNYCRISYFLDKNSSQYGEFYKHYLIVFLSVVASSAHWLHAPLKIGFHKRFPTIKKVQFPCYIHDILVHECIKW